MLFPRNMVWQSDSRIGAIKDIKSTVARNAWDALEFTTAKPVESVNDFWSLERDSIVIDVTLKEPAPAPRKPPRAEEPQPAVLTLTESLAQMEESPIHETPLGELAVDPGRSRANTLEDRQAELDAFLASIPQAYASKYPVISVPLGSRLWSLAASRLQEHMLDSPGAADDPLWLYLMAEFRYRDMLDGRVNPMEALRAFELFLNMAPENHELASYALYRESQIYRRLGFDAEEEASLSGARSRTVSSFDDLFATRQAQLLVKLDRRDEARDLLFTMREAYPRTPLRAEAEYLLGELAWRAGTPASKVDSYNWFRAMLSQTTSPLAGSPARMLAVAHSLIFNRHGEEALPFLNAIQTKNETPSPEEGESWLLMAQCLNENGEIDKAVGYYERAENKALPSRIRLAAALHLAQAGHEDSRQPIEVERSRSPSYRDPRGTAEMVYRETADPELAVAAGYLWGLIAAERGRYDEAVHVYVTLCHDYPDTPLRPKIERLTLTYFQEAVAQAYAQRKHEWVVHFFSSNADLAGQIQLDRPTRDCHASSLMRLGFYDEAARIWSKLYEERSDDGALPPVLDPSSLLINLADCLERGKAPEKAMAILNTLARQYPSASETGPAMLVRARCHLDLGDRARAAHALEQAVDSGLTSTEDKTTAYELLSKTYRELGLWGNANLGLQTGLYRLGEARVPITHSEGARRLMAELADLYYSRKQFASATEIYSRYVEIYPNAPDRAMSLYRLGQLLAQEGSYDDARTAFQTLTTEAKDDLLYVALAKTSLQELSLRLQGQGAGEGTK